MVGGVMVADLRRYCTTSYWQTSDDFFTTDGVTCSKNFQQQLFLLFLPAISKTTHPNSRHTYRYRLLAIQHEWCIPWPLSLGYLDISILSFRINETPPHYSQSALHPHHTPEETCQLAELERLHGKGPTGRKIRRKEYSWYVATYLVPLLLYLQVWPKIPPRAASYRKICR